MGGAPGWTVAAVPHKLTSSLTLVHHMMQAPTDYSTCYDSGPSSPAGYQEVKFEFHCYTEDNPDFSPVNDARNFRERIRPPRRPSLARERCRARGEHVDKEALKTASRFMLRKNQVWLSQEDLTTGDPYDIATDTSVRYPWLGTIPDTAPRGPWLGTIPDGEPATLTCSSSHKTLSDHPAPAVPPVVPEPLSPSPSTITQELWTETQASSSSLLNYTSSGTLTPSSDVTMGPETSTKALDIPSVLRDSDVQDASPSASFIMCRGDSVDGLFISSPPKCVSPAEVPEVFSSPTISQQSPFRRQLFTSLMTRQSALVSRVTQHSCRLLETLVAVASAGSDSKSQHRAASAPAHDSVGSIPSGDFIQATSTCWRMREETRSEQASRFHPKVQFDVERCLQDLSAPPPAGDFGPPCPRLAERVSVCDSGLGLDTDDDQRSLSRVSSSASSEDSEGTMEDEQGKTFL